MLLSIPFCYGYFLSVTISLWYLFVFYLFYLCLLDDLYASVLGSLYCVLKSLSEYFACLLEQDRNSGIFPFIAHRSYRIVSWLALEIEFLYDLKRTQSQSLAGDVVVCFHVFGGELNFGNLKWIIEIIPCTLNSAAFAFIEVKLRKLWLDVLFLMYNL